MSWKTLDAFDLAGKRVLTRVDINVPMANGMVTDTTRIERIIPTVKDIVTRGGRVVLLAHFGRPKAVFDVALSLKQLVPTLSYLFGQTVQFTDDDTYDAVLSQTKSLKNGEILLIENVRFYPGETTNDPAFSKMMAAFGDIYCNDAFSAAHRAHASTAGVAAYLPSCAGRSMQAELGALEQALSHPKHPVVALVGGAKVSTKLDLLGNLIPKVDQIIIGGGMANTFLAAMGHNVGKSLCEYDLADTARAIIAKAKAGNCTLVLPSDVVTATEFKAGAQATICAVTACPADAIILDAGPDSIAAIKAVLDNAKTLVWNGPLGAFEFPPFNAATDAAALHAAALSKAGKLLSVAGGGDTVAALNASGAASDFTYISTAGGAFLEWLEGKTLPGVAALVQNNISA
jgi:phosphoglycerate kinase